MVILLICKMNMTKLFTNIYKSRTLTPKASLLFRVSTNTLVKPVMMFASRKYNNWLRLTDCTRHNASILFLIFSDFLFWCGHHDVDTSEKLEMTLENSNTKSAMLKQERKNMACATVQTQKERLAILRDTGSVHLWHAYKAQNKPKLVNRRLRITLIQSWTKALLCMR